MYLKRIELGGFKSFPNKKEIIINRGITGVVGPNGSGKSNIADALRWVLGEQSSKNLRGTTMQDVIFNGTQNRTKKSYCAVSLVFDNTDSRIDSEFSEISVTRKMFRSGESEYLINNVECRLKDILELFRDTGIGKEGYSIIGQGRIDEILTSKAIARRKVFEEAAGIMKYRVRKEEAERNLQKTKDNIVRLDDILKELEIQVGPLEKQMMQAKEFFSLRDTLKELEINLFLHKYEKANERIAFLNKQVKDCEDDYEKTVQTANVLAKEVVLTKQKLQTVEQEIEVHHRKAAEFIQQQEKLKGSFALIEEKEKNHSSQIVQNEAKIKECDVIIAEQTQKTAEYNCEMEEINSQIDAMYGQILEMKEQSEEFLKGAEDIIKQIAEAKQEAEQSRNALQSFEMEYKEKDLRKKMIQEQISAIKNKKDEQEEQGKRLAQTDVELTARNETVEKKTADLRNKTNEVAQSLLEIAEQKNKHAQNVLELQKKVSEEKSRYKLLSEMREELEGYFDSVKSLFAHARQAPHIKSKLRGVLAEVINVPKEYEVPIEIILGNALQNVVVNSDQDAKVIIDYLRKNKLGRITFLPTQSLSVKYLKDKERSYLNENGVLCVASEAIVCDDEIRPAVDFLLGRTVIVKDMDCAINLMRKAGHAFRTVTMQGDFIKPGGVITGGSVAKNNLGLLARKRMAQELKISVEETQKKETTALLALQAVEKAEKSKKEERQTLFQELRTAEIEQAEVKQQLLTHSQKIADHNRIMQNRLQEYSAFEAEIAQLQANMQQDEVKREVLTKRYADISEKLEELEEYRQKESLAHSEQREKLSQAEIAQNSVKHKKDVLLSKIEHANEIIFNAKHESQLCERQTQTLNKDLVLFNTQKVTAKKELDSILKELNEVGEESHKKASEKDELYSKIEASQKKADELNEQKDGYIEQKYKTIANCEKTQLAVETMQTKIWEEYELTYANAIELKKEGFSHQAANKQIDEIRSVIRSMGAVNPNAIEDYGRVKERLDDLTIQREDLNKAQEDLYVVIQALLESMKSSFQAKFTMINERFSQVFKELFGGGHAEVELADEGNILECGIDIIAEPPGKKLQSLTLLSGGEKALTAIALLFAMLSINPSPICLLDEIDAPLDDANVVRLSDYLTKLKNELQFIVITHRKPTMAVCDTLYGVAMHEKGVSDIVSVKLGKEV